jgi:hypothetical protein
MKKIILLTALFYTALSSHAQKTQLPATRTQQTIKKSVGFNDKLRNTVPPERQAAFAGTFNNADNISTRPSPNSAQNSTEMALNAPPAANPLRLTVKVF